MPKKNTGHIGILLPEGISRLLEVAALDDGVPVAHLVAGFVAEGLSRVYGVRIGLDTDDLDDDEEAAPAKRRSSTRRAPKPPKNKTVAKKAKAAKRGARAGLAGGGRSTGPGPGDKHITQVLDLNNRAKFALRTNKIDTIEKLCNLTLEDLNKMSGLGNGSIAEIVAQLKRKGLSLRAKP